MSDACLGSDVRSYFTAVQLHPIWSKPADTTSRDFYADLTHYVKAIKAGSNKDSTSYVCIKPMKADSISVPTSSIVSSCAMFPSENR